MTYIQKFCESDIEKFHSGSSSTQTSASGCFLDRGKGYLQVQPYHLLETVLLKHWGDSWTTTFITRTKFVSAKFGQIQWFLRNLRRPFPARRDFFNGLLGNSLKRELGLLGWLAAGASTARRRMRLEGRTTCGNTSPLAIPPQLISTSRRLSRKRCHQSRPFESVSSRFHSTNFRWWSFKSFVLIGLRTSNWSIREYRRL